MTQRFNYPFNPVRGTTAPSFEVATIASTANALESTALSRVWQGPSNRVVRLVESSGVDYYVNFGSSAVAAASSDSILCLGGAVQLFNVAPAHGYVAIASASTTSAEVNVTLGYGH